MCCTSKCVVLQVRAELSEAQSATAAAKAELESLREEWREAATAHNTERSTLEGKVEGLCAAVAGAEAAAAAAAEREGNARQLWHEGEQQVRPTMLSSTSNWPAIHL